MGVGDGFLALGELTGAMRSLDVYERRGGRWQNRGEWSPGRYAGGLGHLSLGTRGRYVKNLLTELEQGQRKWLLTHLVLG